MLTPPTDLAQKSNYEWIPWNKLQPMTKDVLLLVLEVAANTIWNSSKDAGGSSNPHA